MIVWGEGKEEHDQRLRSCLIPIPQSRFKFNRSKCIFTSKSFTVLGHIISANCVKPDPTKVNAILTCLFLILKLVFNTSLDW